MTDPVEVSVPQPFVVSIRPAPARRQAGPPPADWSGAVKQLRDVAQWIIGGVVVTAAGVFAGGTLTNLGHLDLASDRDRLGIALGGVALGFAALTVILIRGLDVIAPAGGSLRLLAKAKRGLLVHARKWLFESNGIKELEANLETWLDHQKTVDARKYLPRIYPCAAFAIVRARFNRLLRTMMIATPLAIIGFGLFAWAANPPEKPSAPERGIVIKITH